VDSNLEKTGMEFFCLDLVGNHDGIK